MDWLVLLLSLGVSLALPAAIIAVRHTVKLQRQGIIQDLEKVFRLDTEQAGEEAIVPSFEFVKFKYFMDRAPGPQAKRQDVPIGAFIVASIPLVLILTVLGVVAFGTLLSHTLSHTVPKWEMHFLPVWPLIQENNPRIWLAVMIVAYLASYLFVVRTLLRAIENFDLSPTTFLSSTIHVLFGAVTAVVIALTLSEVVPGAGGAQSATLSGLLVAAFAVGYLPDLGLRSLLRSTKLTSFKRENEDIYRAFKATPLEIIDGIDSETRSRLSEHHIETVQNLATANPIMLFVETPYGVYQVIDWVAQAQLCAAVGPAVLAEFWKLGIRTIFDLERAVLDPKLRQPELHRAIGLILVLNAHKYRGVLSLDPASPAGELNASVVTSLVLMITDDLHVRRLRQIWNRIAGRLGAGSICLMPGDLPYAGMAEPADQRRPEMGPEPQANGAGVSEAAVH